NKTRTTNANVKPASFFQRDLQFVFMPFSFNRPPMCSGGRLSECNGGRECARLAKVTGRFVSMKPSLFLFALQSTIQLSLATRVWFDSLFSPERPAFLDRREILCARV